MKQADGQAYGAFSQAGDLDRNAAAILFVLLTTGVLLFRLFMTPHLMNMIVPYTSEGGPFYSKFHFGTYFIAFLLVLSLFTRQIPLRGDDVPLLGFLLRQIGLMSGLLVYVVLISRIGATGTIVDTYLAACFAAVLMLTNSPQGRRAIGTFILMVMILGAVIAIGEAIIQKRLMPFTESEPSFRATGLAGHPLSLGAQCVLAIGFVTQTRWRIWIKAGAVLVVLLGCAASGARTALILASAEVMLLLLFVRWPKLSLQDQRKAKLVAFVFAMVSGVGLVAVLMAAGLLDRFQGAIADGNFMARIDIYRTFGFVSWKDIFFGMDARVLLATVNEKLRLPYIESAPVLIVLAIGLPAAIFLTGVVICFVVRLLRGSALPAKIAVTMFLIADLSNNALATKTGDVVLLTVLVLAFRPRPEQLALRPSRQGVLSMISSRPLRVRV